MNDTVKDILLRLITGYSNFASGLSKAGAVLAALLMAGMTLHVILEILLRSVFSTSTFVLDEFVGYGVAAMTFLALGHAFETNTLIRVTSLLIKIRQNIIRRLVEVLCVSSALMVSSYVALYFWKSVVRNLARGSTSETIAEVPLWIPEGLVLVGLVIFIMQMVAYILKVVSGQSLLSEKSAE